MDPWLLNLEVMALSAMLVLVFALRTRLGRAPLYVCLGVLLVFLTIPHRLGVSVNVIGEVRGSYGSILHLSLILTGIVLVYALEGTSRARRLIIGIAIALVLLFTLRWLLAQHIAGDGLDPAVYGRKRWMSPRLGTNLASVAALVVDGLIIIVVYQALINAWRKIPIVLAFSLSLVAGMVADGLVYGAVTGLFNSVIFVELILAKMVAGVAAALPAAVYISWEFRRRGDALQDGLIHRRALNILDLREELRLTKAAVVRSRAEAAHIKRVFGRYVAPDVVEEILSDISRLELGGELREVTILFADIRGYSTLSEHMSPTQTIDLLNRYFTAMTEIIQGHKGTIIEFEGDAVLAVFGAPLDHADHADRAIRTAVDMLEGVVELNRRWEADGTAHYWHDVGFEDFRIRIGIHSGDVVVGNLGSESRTKYAVIGDTVNIAARVESLNKTFDTTLLLTGETRRQLTVDVPLEDLGAHSIRGRGGTVELFTLAQTDTQR